MKSSQAGQRTRWEVSADGIGLYADPSSAQDQAISCNQANSLKDTSALQRDRMQTATSSSSARWNARAPGKAPETNSEAVL